MIYTKNMLREYTAVIGRIIQNYICLIKLCMVLVGWTFYLQFCIVTQTAEILLFDNFNKIFCFNLRQLISKFQFKLK